MRDNDKHGPSPHGIFGKRNPYKGETSPQPISSEEAERAEYRRKKQRIPDHLRDACEVSRAASKGWRAQFKEARHTLDAKAEAERAYEKRLYDPYDRQMVSHETVTRQRKRDAYHQRNRALLRGKRACARCKLAKTNWAWSYMREQLRKGGIDAGHPLCTACAKTNVKRAPLLRYPHYTWTTCIAKNHGAQGITVKGHTIRLARERIGISQRDFAVHAGYSRAYQQRIERNQAMRITQACARGIRDALQLLTR